MATITKHTAPPPLPFSPYLNERFYEEEFNLFHDLYFKHIKSHYNLYVYSSLVEEVNCLDSKCG